MKASVDDQIYIIALKNSDIFSNYLKEKEIINGKCLGSGVTVGERNCFSLPPKHTLPPKSHHWGNDLFHLFSALVPQRGQTRVKQAILLQ